MLNWRSMDIAERDREYSPSSCLPDGDYRPFVAEYQRASQAAWSQVDQATGVQTSVVRYGPADSQTIDVAVPAVAGAPVPIVVYLHGGYWQELSKADSLFAAWDCVQRGWAFAAVEYTLAPQASLTEIANECRQALSALQEQAPALGFDPAHVVVAGSSGGAQLAAMVALGPADPRPRVWGAVLVSGIFELEPLIGTSIDHALALDVETARQNSPLHADLQNFPPTVVAYGSNETSEFKAQSHTFADKLEAGGRSVTLFEVDGRNHFDVILDLATPGTLLGDAVAELVDTRRDLDAYP